MSIKNIWNGAKISDDIKRRIPTALNNVASFIEDESNQRAPRDEGAMINSSNVHIDGNTAAISYNVPYALKQHEDLELHHPHGGSAKFLSRAIDENRTRIEQFLRDSLKL